MSIIPAPEAKAITTIQLSQRKVREIDEIAALESAKPMAKRAGKIYSRNEIMASLLDYATTAYWKIEGRDPPVYTSEQLEVAMPERRGRPGRPPGPRKPTYRKGETKEESEAARLRAALKEKHRND